MTELARPSTPVPGTGEAHPAPEPDALAALRAATRDVHAQLDSALPLAREQATLADYALHLHALGGWLAALDGAVHGPNEPPGWTERQQQREELLAQDWSDCGAAAQGLPDVPACVALPRACPAYGWGLAYVVEGSQLGGSVLYRRLEERLAPHPLRYLRGAGGGRYWPTFTTDLRHAVVTTCDIGAACEGAVAAFGLLMRRFQQLGVAV